MSGSTVLSASPRGDDGEHPACSESAILPMCNVIYLGSCESSARARPARGARAEAGARGARPARRAAPAAPRAARVAARRARRRS